MKEYCVRRIVVFMFCVFVSSICILNPSYADEEIEDTCDPELTDMTVDYGDYIICSISPAGDSDYYRIWGNEGDRMVIEVIDLDSDGLEPRLLITTPSGEILQDTWSSTSAAYNGILEETGKYTIEISDWGSQYYDQNNDTGQYSVSFVCNGGSCLPESGEETYQSGRQSCIDDPESCGLRPAKSAFTGEIAENVQTYLTLTEDSVPFYLSPGSYVQTYGTNGTNTLNVEEYARLKCQNFIGENEINMEENSSQFTVYRSGATVYLNSTSGTRVEIAATETSQTLRFADGSLELAIIDGNVMLGSQTIDETEQSIGSDVDSSDTSESIF